MKTLRGPQRYGYIEYNRLGYNRLASVIKSIVVLNACWWKTEEKIPNRKLFPI